MLLQEQVSGPVRGYYIAAYACPVGEFGRQFIGYFKVFQRQPRSYFDDLVCLVKGVSGSASANPKAALMTALSAATAQVMNLPPAGEVTECVEQRH